jgi:hypothetical protein
VTVLAFHALGAPAPILRQLPVGEVRGQLVRDAVAKGAVGGGHVQVYEGLSALRAKMQRDWNERQRRR